MPSCSATRSAARLVGIERAMPVIPSRIARREMGVGGEQRQTVGGRDEQPAADDQVAVAVSVGGGAQIGRGLAHRQIEEMLGIDEIGVGVVAAEIGQRRRR